MVEDVCMDIIYMHIYHTDLYVEYIDVEICIYSAYVLHILYAFPAGSMWSKSPFLKLWLVSWVFHSPCGYPAWYFSFHPVLKCTPVLLRANIHEHSLRNPFMGQLSSHNPDHRPQENSYMLLPLKTWENILPISLGLYNVQLFIFSKAWVNLLVITSVSRQCAARLPREPSWLWTCCGDPLGPELVPSHCRGTAGSVRQREEENCQFWAVWLVQLISLKRGTHVGKIGMKWLRWGGFHVPTPTPVPHTSTLGSKWMPVVQGSSVGEGGDNGDRPAVWSFGLHCSVGRLFSIMTRAEAVAKPSSPPLTFVYTERYHCISFPHLLSSVGGFRWMIFPLGH